MPGIRIEQDRALRVITSVMRGKMPPPEVNALARAICDGLIASTPGKPGPYRAIPKHVGGDRLIDFREALGAVLKREDPVDVSWRVWEIVYSFGRELPATEVV